VLLSSERQEFSCALECVADMDQKEALRKEVTDLKRSVSEEVYEKEAVQRTANDLRNMVKKLEAEKVENSRVIQELKQRLTCMY
jgi:predicted RNase H-like nuclease (RuvC/YqgF family)